MQHVVLICCVVNLSVSLQTNKNQDKQTSVPIKSVAVGLTPVKPPPAPSKSATAEVWKDDMSLKLVSLYLIASEFLYNNDAKLCQFLYTGFCNSFDFYPRDAIISARCQLLDLRLSLFVCVCVCVVVG